MAPPQNQPASGNTNNYSPNDPNASNDAITFTNFYKKAANPTVCLLTVGFKLAAAISFILLDIFTSSEALVYLVVILIGAADFWMTKNLSGRILVGLRWWNMVKETGDEVWVFESKNESKKNSITYNRTRTWSRSNSFLDISLR